MAQQEPTWKKKLTLKVITGQKTERDVVEFMKDKAKKNAKIARIKGALESYREESGFKGQGINFVLYGQFFAFNYETGEIMESDKLYLPKDVSSRWIAAFQQRKQDVTSVIAEYDVFVEPFDSDKGYTYVFKAEGSPEHYSRRGELLATMKALPAPKKAA